MQIGLWICSTEGRNGELRRRNEDGSRFSTELVICTEMKASLFFCPGKKAKKSPEQGVCMVLPKTI